MVFGAYGAIGEAVARRLARDGHQLHLVGRDAARLATLAHELAAGTHVADATDDDQVQRVFAEIAPIELTFTAVGPRADEHAYGRPAAAVSTEQFMRTLGVVAGAQFAVARAAALAMAPRGRGVIITLSASLSAQFVPLMAGITAACAAVEGMTRSLAAELGPRGVRVNCVRAGGMPSTRTIQETTAAIARSTGAPVDVSSTNLLRTPLVPAEVAEVVAWLGSDAASGVAGQIVNVCHGAIVSR